MNCIIHVWIHRWTFQHTMTVMLNEQNVSVFLHYYRQHHFIPSSYHLPDQRSYFIYVLIHTPCTHNIGTCEHGPFTRDTGFFFLRFSSENGRVIWQSMPCTRVQRPKTGVWEPTINVLLFSKYIWIGCAKSRLRYDEIFWRIIVYFPFHFISHRKTFNFIFSILRFMNEFSILTKAFLVQLFGENNIQRQERVTKVVISQSFPWHMNHGLQPSSLQFYYDFVRSFLLI